ncbi:MAG: efflux RND transporter periplasmic adaptor subunit [Verrucomicrobia bacterium]|nr:efflux RND transporter periplasmic adaptor subunit [Verrucomicrobiota bacterium]
MMKRLVYAALVTALVAAAFLMGTGHGRRSAGAANGAAQRQVLYYVDPMNPTHTSDQPGLAPCGMKMEPVYADAAPGASGRGGLAAAPAGSVQVSPAKQQLIGVKLGVVEKKALGHTQRLLGRVVVDETRVYRLNATVNGWITKALPCASGSRVKRHEVLASFYSPDFLSAGQALIFALGSKDRAQATGQDTNLQNSRVTQFNVNVQQYVDALKNLGMGEMQVQEIIANRKLVPSINLTAPTDGVILTRNVSEGLRFEKGTELFRLADLGQVWILADAFENEAHWFKAGQPVTVSLPRQAGVLKATVSQAVPQFDSGSRTLKVRLEADNPDYALKPDMFVDVHVPVTLPETLVVSADAVLDAGQHQTVFVDRGQGVFEPRVVETGRRLGDQVEIVRGLMPGERVVISGNFLLDSESRMKLAAAATRKTEMVDPVCGMTVDPLKAKAKNCVSEYQGQTYYFCMDGCKRTFDDDPAGALKATAEKPADSSAALSHTGSDVRHP